MLYWLEGPGLEHLQPWLDAWADALNDLDLPRADVARADLEEELARLQPAATPVREAEVEHLESWGPPDFLDFWGRLWWSPEHTQAAALALGQQQGLPDSLLPLREAVREAAISSRDAILMSCDDDKERPARGMPSFTKTRWHPPQPPG
jgi:hypothetical protein